MTERAAKFLYFPKSFLWGACLCDYQHFGGSRCDLPLRWTAKHSSFYRKDFKFILWLGLNAFRTGIEWARIEPKENFIDKKAVKSYHSYFTALKKLGVKTFVTLHHFTNPAWVHDHGGWLSGKIVEKFIAYVDFVSSELSDYIDYYVVINEPAVYAFLSYMAGERGLPPYHRDMNEALTCHGNLIEALDKGCKVIHKNNSKAEVGFSHFVSTFVPDDPSDPENVEMCKVAKDLMVYSIPDALKDQIDYMGIDKYVKTYISKEGMPTKHEIHPEGLRYYLKDFYERYRKPIAIIENGFPTSDDETKIKYMLDHVKQVHDAIYEDGVNVFTYHWWSFLHGYEWGYEYRPFFALIDVDIDKTYKRTLTKTAETYRQTCRQKRLPPKPLRNLPQTTNAKRFQGLDRGSLAFAEKRHGLNMKESLRELLKNPKRHFGKGPWTIASAPGRADFLNTHQDYKSLPVVPVGIDLRTFIFAKVLNGDIFKIRSLNLEELKEPYMDTFRVGKNDMLGKGWFGNYFRGIINVLVERRQVHKLKGLDIIIKSQIPVGSGLASSAALEIAFLKLVNHLFNLGYTNKDLAEIAYLAETKEVGVPCGRLDQYGSVFGGIIKLECRYPYNVEQLPFNDLIFAIIDSGIRHATKDIHPVRQEEINNGLKTLMESKKVSAKLKAKLGNRYDEPLWEKISEEEITSCLPLLDKKARKRFLYTLKTQKLTEFALRILRQEIIDSREIIKCMDVDLAEKIMRKSLRERSCWILGKIMNQQHELLRDLYEVSLPELEKIREAAIGAGAYGVKISGAGLGGSLIALVKDSSMGYKVLDASLSAGAKQGWISKVSPGAKIESCKYKIQQFKLKDTNLV